MVTQFEHLQSCCRIPSFFFAIKSLNQLIIKHNLSYWFKLLPCSECCFLCFGWFPGIWISLLLFVVTNKKLFLLNSQIYDINTHYNNNLHLLLTGLTLVQKGVAYSGCKIYNHLPLQIKNISNNVPLCKSKLKKFLLRCIFYIVDEYYQQNYNDYDWLKKKKRK